MSNIFNSNPIVLDTFTSDIDIGQTLFGNSNALFFVDHIEWQNPNAINDVCVIRNGAGVEIMSATCTTAKQNIVKRFGGQAIPGIKIQAGQVSSGKVSIALISWP